MALVPKTRDDRDAHELYVGIGPGLLASNHSKITWLYGLRSRRTVRNLHRDTSEVLHNLGTHKPKSLRRLLLAQKKGGLGPRGLLGPVAGSPRPLNTLSKLLDK